MELVSPGFLRFPESHRPHRHPIKCLADVLCPHRNHFDIRQFPGSLAEKHAFLFDAFDQATEDSERRSSQREAEIGTGADIPNPEHTAWKMSCQERRLTIVALDNIFRLLRLVRLTTRPQRLSRSMLFKLLNLAKRVQ